MRNMETAPLERQAPGIPLDLIFESAVVLGWKDLGQPLTDGMIQLEYHVGAERSVESLKMWCANGRGYLSLVCDYSVNPGWSGGPRFANGYHSRQLGRLLETIVMNQVMFQNTCQPGNNVLLKVGAPSETQVADATRLVTETFAKPPDPPAKQRRQSARLAVSAVAPS
jgi:hypothetical protein